MGRLIEADAVYKILESCEIKKDTYGSLLNDWDHGYNCGIERAESEIECAPTVEAEPKWIPVSERLPKQGQEVICQCRASIIKVLKLDANGDWYQDANHCYMSGFVIAWMPLPKPYERKEECHME